METTFYTNRKRLIQEEEVVQSQVQVQGNVEQAAKMAELRLKLREENMASEREHCHNATKLRELQRMLSDERQHCEKLEYKVTRKAAQADLVKDYESKVQKLTQELNEVQKRLFASEKKLRQAFPLVPKIQQKWVEK